MSNLNILAKSPSIIYRPGGAPGGLVVTSWAQVQKFVAARQGAVTVGGGVTNGATPLAGSAGGGGGGAGGPLNGDGSSGGNGGSGQITSSYRP